MTDAAGRRHALTALRHRDMRLLTVSTVAAMTAAQVESVTVAWQVYTLTDSALQLGLLGLFRFVPFLAFALVGGALADAADRRAILRGSQAVQLAVIGALALSTATGAASPPLLFGAVVVSAVAASFDSPARSALIPHVVPRNELANAFTLATLSREFAFILGPAVAGLIIAQSGIAASYAVGATAVVISLLALLALRRTTVERGAEVRGAEAVLGGLRFLRGEPLLLWLLLAAVPGNLFGGYEVLLPVFARDVLHVGAAGLGFLHSARSLGAVVGGVALSGLGLVTRPVTAIIGAIALQGMCLIALGLSSVFGLSLVLLFTIGGASVLSEVARATLTVERTPDRLRGRVMAVQQVVFQGGPRLGSLNIGAMIAAFGPVSAAVAGGVVVLAATVGISRLGVIRRGVAAEAATPAGVTR